MNKEVMGVHEVSPGYEFVAENPAVPVGYKQTEVGVIPEDWSNTRLDQLISFISYGFTNPMPTTEDGIYMLTAVDINNGKIQLNKARKTSIEAYQRLLTDKSRPKPNDILLTKDGTLGRLATVGTETVCINQSIAVIRTNDKADPNFLKLLLESAPYQKKMLEDAGGSTIKHIYITIVDKMHVGLPLKVGEQRAIATALDDVDALLEELDRLIAKKRDIKQAAMQQLLTGETRLPGFEGEWEVKTLREISRIQRGASPRPIDSPIWFDDNSLIGWVRISDVTSSGMFLEKTSQKLSSLGVQQSRPVPAGSLIMSICATVGRPIVTKVDVCIHDGFVVFDSLEANQLFIFYFLKWIEPKWSQHGQTGSQMNLNTGLINGTEIKLPPMDEQMAIAECLFDMDAEIQALEQRRSKTAELKQGMMQELLTGRTRLV
jgi:type I restriction enzyme S subunit